MPAQDILQLVRASVERSREIPAQLDAFGEFVSSPIGPSELRNLGAVFATIQANLAQRFPEVASIKAANHVRSEISSFLSVTGDDVERIKNILRGELRKADSTMASSISERFSRMSLDDRRAIDATLRLIRNSQVEILFRTEAGKPLSSAGVEFSRFFATVKAESPNMRELRYQNLIVEKAVFDRLLLKSTSGTEDYHVWVPSFFAKENVDELITKISLSTEQLIYTHLTELKNSGSMSDRLRKQLEELISSSGVLTQPTDVPQEIEDYMHFSPGDRFVAMAPVELDGVILFLNREKEERDKARELEERKIQAEKEEASRKAEAEKLRITEIRKANARAQQRSIQVVQMEKKAEKNILPPEQLQEGMLLGKKIDLNDFLRALSRRSSEKEIAEELKPVGEFRINFSAIFQRGVVIAGSSGSGRSALLKRILDGLGAIHDSPKVFVIDQKGEHRGVAWKYGWDVFAFVPDSQAKQLAIHFPSGEGEPELLADIIQEWCLDVGVQCSDVQRMRIASAAASFLGGNEVRSLPGVLSLVSHELSKDRELFQIGQKIGRNLLPKISTTRAFSEAQRQSLNSKAALFDLSGRGLRDPPSREERLIASVLILQFLSSSGISDSIIAIEDTLDRFKSESLKNRCLSIMSDLRAKTNSIVATSKGAIREFVGEDCFEILERLSGEKAIREVLAGFKTEVPLPRLQATVGFIPRGYAITSKLGSVPSTALRIEPVQYSSTAQ